jgi:hypothetical protein
MRFALRPEIRTQGLWSTKQGCHPFAYDICVYTTERVLAYRLVKLCEVFPCFSQ